MRSAVAAFLAALLVPVLALPAGADPGDIDAGWGFFGRVGIEAMTGDPVAPAGTGRILVPTSCGTGCGTVVRLDAATGRQDETFAPAGTVPFTITELLEVPSGVLALGAGAVARYSADGQLDRTFGTAGSTTLPESMSALAAAQETATSPIYVGGSLTRAAQLFPPCSGIDGALTALSPSGAVDGSFAGTGLVRQQAAEETAITGLLAVGGGVVAGMATARNRQFVHGCVETSSDDRGLVMRYLPTGAVDRSFGEQDGAVWLPYVHVAADQFEPKVGLAPFGSVAMMVTAGHEVRRMTLTGGPDSWVPVPATTTQSIVPDGRGGYLVGGSRMTRLAQPPGTNFTVDGAFGSCGYTNVAGTPIVVGDHVLVRQHQVLLRLDLDAGPAAPLGGSRGAWVVDSGGAVHTSGEALWCGPSGRLSSSAPVVGIAVAPSQNGYWVVTADGAVERFGHARHFGDLRGKHLNQPIVGMATTPLGNGYWLVARDGGIFSFGDARFFGSTGNLRLNKPIVGMTSSPTGDGYWFVASDGGIFSFGDARFHGSTGARPPATPIVGMAATPSGQGYFLAAAGGGVFAFGDASLGDAVLRPIGRVVGISAFSRTGCRLFGADGRSATYNGPNDLDPVKSDRPIVAGASGR